MATPHRTPYELTGADGGPLRVDVRRQPRGAGPAVIICHGFKAFKDWGFFPVLADRIARAGLTAISFNFSGSGVGQEGDRYSEPERFGHATFSGDLDDIAIVRKAAAAGTFGPVPARLGLFGHSRGGGMIVAAAAADPVDALVTWNPIGRTGRWGRMTLMRWRLLGRLEIEDPKTGEVLPLYTDVLDDLDRHRDRLDLPAAARRVTAPWLNIVGTGDIVVPPEQADWGEQPRTLSVEGANHTFGVVHPWAGTTPWLDEAMDATLEWFLARLGG